MWMSQSLVKVSPVARFVEVFAHNFSFRGGIEGSDDLNLIVYSGKLNIENAHVQYFKMQNTFAPKFHIFNHFKS